MNKWEKLAQDILDANKDVKEALVGVEDGGSCNLDSAVLYGWRRCTSLTKAFRAAGIREYWGERYGKRILYVPCLVGSGQAARNQIASETLAESLKTKGYEAVVQYVMD